MTKPFREYIPPIRPPLKVGDTVMLKAEAADRRIPEMAKWYGVVKAVEYGRALIEWPEKIEDGKVEPRLWNEPISHLRVI